MPRRQVKREDLDNVFAITDRRREPSPYDLKYKRCTYQVEEMAHDKLKAIAEQNHVGLNDLVRWIFDRFIYGYENEEIVLPVEEYVVTYSRLSE